MKLGLMRKIQQMVLIDLKNKQNVHNVKQLHEGGDGVIGHFVLSNWLRMVLRPYCCSYLLVLTFERIACFLLFLLLIIDLKFLATLRLYKKDAA